MATEDEAGPGDRRAVISYLHLRRSIGAMGIALPLVLAALRWASRNGLEPTIRDYYHAERGYEDLSSRFRSLGAELTPVED